MTIIKPYTIVEKGKDKPFIWNGKKMTFRSKVSAKNIVKDIKKDFFWIDLEIKECYNKDFKRILSKRKKSKGN
jgi:hypothetical protein